jgi:hypothetical protein
VEEEDLRIKEAVIIEKEEENNLNYDNTLVEEEEMFL